LIRAFGDDDTKRRQWQAFLNRSAERQGRCAGRAQLERSRRRREITILDAPDL